MKRLLTWTMALGLLTSMSFVQAEQATAEISPYEAMYKTINMPEKVLGDDIVEVTEVFLYTCPHCYRIHPFAEKWKESVADQKDVVFNPMPAVFSEKNTPLAKAYYMAKDLGREELHEVLFETIHNKGKRIVTKDQVKAFFVGHGVDEKAFDKSYKSFAVDNAVRTANFLTVSYGISGVPSLIVNGKYLVLSSKTKGYKEMFNVVDYLVEKERKLIAATAKKAKPAE
ncbi:thiol:disulfide interchange protein DsbA/DsbL [Candidatus Albibeggiatoa sp. nov. NOAA]|uniref:thiol:disulfide interchange protein DsbA/DsbL n=1 Tax=Candidatus Albibeggiatoa sp. nov. NOAA TaxID=3162724 RepID=UPI00330349A6|nr:thiol:disulfide interchange protein DsbA/DsbL [Thiotrichaceae bacterium]